MATLTVNLLGEPRLHSPGGPVACASRKSLGLFCYLALSGARHSRRELAKLFWGGANPDFFAGTPVADAARKLLGSQSGPPRRGSGRMHDGQRRRSTP